MPKTVPEAVVSADSGERAHGLKRLLDHYAHYTPARGKEAWLAYREEIKKDPNALKTAAARQWETEMLARACTVLMRPGMVGLQSDDMPEQEQLTAALEDESLYADPVVAAYLEALAALKKHDTPQARARVARLATQAATVITQRAMTIQLPIVPGERAKTKREQLKEIQLRNRKMQALIRYLGERFGYTSDPFTRCVKAALDADKSGKLLDVLCNLSVNAMDQLHEKVLTNRVATFAQFCKCVKEVGQAAEISRAAEVADEIAVEPVALQKTTPVASTNQ